MPTVMPLNQATSLSIGGVLLADVKIGDLYGNDRNELINLT